MTWLKRIGIALVLLALPVLWFFTPTPPEVLLGATEVTIEGTLSDATDHFKTGSDVVFTTSLIGYAFYRDSGGSIVYKRTDDGGGTWDAAVDVDAGIDNCAVSVWYDQWTPGDTTGTRIHIAWMDSGGDNVWYAALDTTDDTLDAAPTNAFEPGLQSWSCVGSDLGPAITKATDGDLFVSNTAGTATHGVGSSTDSGVTWSNAGGAMFEADDHVALVPLASGGVLAIYNDISADTLLSRKFTNSPPAWDSSDTTVDASFIDSSLGGYADSFGATVNKSTNAIYVVGNNNPLSSGGDVKAYKYTSSWSTLTDPSINIGTTGTQGKVALDNNTGDLYALFTFGAAGSETIVYRKSTDDGSTWGATTTISSTADDLRHPSVTLNSSTYLYATWFNDDLNTMLGATIADVTPAAPPSSGAVDSIIWFSED